MQKVRTRQPPLSGSFGYPLGFLAAVGVTATAVTAHGTAHPQWTLGALAVTAAAIAAITTLRAALASAAVSWAMHVGFVLGRRGEITFTAAGASAIAVLLAAVVIGHAASWAFRHARRPAREPVPIPAPRDPVRLARTAV